jgi:adenylyltransferase/sulfurtransferase
MLSGRERRRYEKQIMLPEIGERGQEAIKSGKVLVVGAGGLGCPVLQYLSAAGTGYIGIVEFDLVNETNIHRQILYGGRDIGKLKSIIAKNILERLNDLNSVEIFNLRLSAANAFKLISSFDIVVDATDNYETRYIIDSVCMEQGKPMIHGAIYKNEGQVSVFNYKGGPSYSSYNPYDVSKLKNPAPSEVGLLGMLPGITGTIMATEAIKIMTGAGDVLSNKVLIFNIMNYSFKTISLG